jgi:pimeloyl-ACP methyl ester carboxylesterase
VPYIRGGSGPGEAAVFFGVNALFRHLNQTTDPARYSRQVSRLLPAHRFIVLGYAGFSFDEIVQDMTLAVRTPPDVVVGISFGGFVAMRFAARYPELVRRLVLLSAHRFSPRGWQMIQRQCEALERRDFKALVRENAVLFRRPWYNWLIRLMLWKSKRPEAPGFREPAEILRAYNQLFGPDFQRNAEYARQIVCPTLVIGGTADQLFDREAFKETANLIRNAEIQLFENETHMLPIERSGAVATTIKSFLGRTDR